MSEHVRRVIEVVGGWVTQTVEWSSATEKERCSKSRLKLQKIKAASFSFQSIRRMFLKFPRLDPRRPARE